MITCSMLHRGYLKSGQFSNKLSSLLFKLRRHCVNEFQSYFQSSTQPILDQRSRMNNDTQEHAPICQALIKHMEKNHKSLLKSFVYSRLYGRCHFICFSCTGITSVVQILRKKKRVKVPSRKILFP